VNTKINCAQARRIDLVDYLQYLGYTPQKVRGREYWYLSPLRVENNPSFKVDRQRNIWYDHGLGLGGTMIDFGLQFHRCSLPELLGILSKKNEHSFSFHPPHLLSQKDQPVKEPRLQIVHSEPLVNPSLLAYISRRGISHQIAKRYLEQITFRTNEKEFMALGFRNHAGGYELRSASFKGSSAPKDSTLIQGDKNSETLAVFEGVFSFLSYLELIENHHHQLQKMSANKNTTLAKPEPIFLILNSLAFLVRRRETMESYQQINLYLDRDETGVAATEKALHWSEKYQDKSTLYKGHKDLNDYLVYLKKEKLQQTQKKGKGWRRTI
jgi:hypothetical protein